MKVNYINGDALNGGGHRVIAHVCNDAGGWGAGFVRSLSDKWITPEKHYRQAYSDGKVTLGWVQLVGVAPNICVANMVAQTLAAEPVRVKYDALDDCLRKVGLMVQTLTEATGNTWMVHMPRIGVGLGGGSWDIIEPLIQFRLVDAGIPTIVFNYEPQISPGKALVPFRGKSG